MSNKLVPYEPPLPPETFRNQRKKTSKQQRIAEHNIRMARPVEQYDWLGPVFMINIILWILIFVGYIGYTMIDGFIDIYQGEKGWFER